MAEIIKKATRESFGEALCELAKDNKDIVVFDADLAAATKTSIFQKEYEDRTRARHKAVIDARKEAMRAEIISEGIYTPVQPILQPQRGVVGL